MQSKSVVFFSKCLLQLGVTSTVLVSLSAPVFAQQQEDNARRGVVVTASRLEQQLTDTIAHTTVITQKDIRESQIADLPNLLRREAGFEFTQNGGIGSATGIFLRGGAGTQVLVLIDGVRVGSTTLGTTQIEGIMLDQVERVEVVRGNVSALYGAGAIGGVIQVFTKQGDGPPRAEAQLMLGDRGTSRASAGYRGSSGDTRFNFNVTRFETAGFSAIDPKLAPRANPDNDGYRNLSFSGQVSHRLAAGHEVGLRAYQNYGEVKFDNAFGAPADNHRSENSVSSYAIYSNNEIQPFWNSQLTLAEGSDKGKTFTNTAAPTKTDTKNTQLQWQNNFKLAPGHVLTGTLERQEQRVQSTTNYTVKGRNVNSALGAYNGRVGAHQFQASLRNDDYSDFGSARSSLGGYGYDITSDWKVTAMRSNAFRAPSFNELFFPGFGNPNLQPERSNSNEVGLQYAAGPHLLRVTGFRTKYRNLIDSPPPTFLPQNVASARVEGNELSYTGQFERWDVRASFTLQDPINAVTGAQLRRRGTNFGNLIASTAVYGWRVGGELIFSGTRPDNDIVSNAPVTLGGYTLLNLTARRQLDKNTFVAARIEKVFAEKYQLAQGFNVPGRGLFVTAGWRQ